jgi:hypothetical protein
MRLTLLLTYRPAAISTSRRLTSLYLSPGLRMALMRSTTAASTWMKAWT